MSIDLSTAGVVVTIVPGVQLGNLQVAALSQWKGVQTALGERCLPATNNDL